MPQWQTHRLNEEPTNVAFFPVFHSTRVSHSNLSGHVEAVFKPSSLLRLPILRSSTDRYEVQE